MKVEIALIRNEFDLDTPTTYLAPAIQAFGSCRYNHLVIIVDRQWVYHAQGKVKKEPWEEYVLQTDREILIGEPLQLVEDPLQYLESQLGKWYDFQGLVLVGWGLATGHMPAYVYHKQRKRLFCTEYGAGVVGMPREPEQTPASFLASPLISWKETVYTMKGVGELRRPALCLQT